MPVSPKRGEIWQVDLEPARGDEMRKTRPAVVVNGNDIGRLNLRFIVPLTGWDSRYERALWMVKIEPSVRNGLAKTSAADAFQARGLSTERFKGKIGTLPGEMVAEIAAAVALVVDYE